jgi:hypothetical protein
MSELRVKAFCVGTIKEHGFPDLMERIRGFPLCI